MPTKRTYLGQTQGSCVAITWQCQSYIHEKTVSFQVRIDGYGDDQGKLRVGHEDYIQGEQRSPAHICDKRVLIQFYHEGGGTDGWLDVTCCRNAMPHLGA